MDIKIEHIEFTDERMRLVFADGGCCDVPLAGFERLLRATPAQRQHWKIIGSHRGIHWLDIDEDLNIHRLLEDFAAPVSSTSTNNVRSPQPQPSAP